MDSDAPQVGGYRLLRQLGSGGMGSVHEAVDAEGRHVALKLLHPHISTDPDARRRLDREVQLLHRVRDAGVARVLDAEVSGAEAFVVTELIEGPTLEEDVTEGGPYAEEDLHALGQDLAEALEAIHAVGVMHRDLKPGNVMLSDHGPVLIDFGIAQVADDARLTQTGMVTGTPGYLAPEVFEGADPGPAGDWWAWAAVLTYAATGRPPFGRGPTAAVLGRVSTGQVDTEGLSPRLAHALRAALHPDPDRRPDRARLLAVLAGQDGGETVALETDTGGATAVLAGGPVAATPEMAAETAPTPAEPEAGAPGGRVGGYGSAGPVAHLPGAPGEQGTRAMPQAQAPYGQQPAGPPPWAGPAGMPHPGGPPPGGPAPGGPAPGSHGGPGGPGDPWGPPGPWYGPGGAQPMPAWAMAPRRRTLLVGAAGLALSATAVAWPGLLAVTVVVLLLVLGTVGWAGRSRREARRRYGLRRGDDARMYAGLPWHLLRAALSALPGLVVGALLAAVALWTRDRLLDQPQLLPAGVDGTVLLWGIGLLFVVVPWLAPTSAPAREGARSVLAVLAPNPVVRGVLGALLVVATAVVVVQVGLGASPQPDWAPLPPTPLTGG